MVNIQIQKLFGKSKFLKKIFYENTNFIKHLQKYILQPNAIVGKYMLATYANSNKITKVY